MKIRVKFNRYGEMIFGDFQINYCVNFSVYRSSISGSYWFYPNDIKSGDVFDIEYIGELSPDQWRIHFVRHEDNLPFVRFAKKPIEILPEEVK